MGVVNFRSDPRISREDRSALRDFCSDLGGDIAQLAVKLGLVIERKDMYPDQSGYIEYDQSCGSASGYKIVVNGKQSIERQKFTVAHELGHYVLHRESDHFKSKQNLSIAQIFAFPSGHRSNDMWDNREYPDWMESEANKFAATVLLPTHLLKRTDEFQSGEPAALARRLNLSVGFVSRRFEEVLFS
jgi:Zn-dependent peptidase ImmA (M78 family)